MRLDPGGDPAKIMYTLAIPLIRVNSNAAMGGGRNFSFLTDFLMRQSLSSQSCSRGILLKQKQAIYVGFTA